MLLLAAATTTADRLREIPAEFWWKLALGIVAFIVLIVFLRKVAKMNKVVLTVVSFVVFVMIGFNWIFERREPAWATPVVGWLSGFLPTKSSYIPNTTPPPPAPAKPAATPAKKSDSK